MPLGPASSEKVYQVSLSISTLRVSAAYLGLAFRAYPFFLVAQTRIGLGMELSYQVCYFTASGVAAIVNFPLWKASAIGDHYPSTQTK
jgi:hypothetical protein